MRKKGSAYWLYGLHFNTKFSFFQKRELRKEVLLCLEHNYYCQTTAKGKRSLRLFDHDFKHYSRLFFRTQQILEISKMMQDRGYNLFNIAGLYDSAPLPAFSFTMESANGPVGVILNRYNSDVSGYTALFDCTIDAYVYYTRERCTHLRISRMRYDDLSAGAALVYTEVMESGKNDAINFYQDTGAKLFSIFFAVQYAVFCQPYILIPTGSRIRKKRYVATDSHSKTYEEVSYADYYLGDTSTIAEQLSPYVSFFDKTTRLFSKKDWTDRIRLIQTMDSFNVG